MSEYKQKVFVPGKGYKGICPVCKQDLYSKADKKYHPECKIAHGNRKASQKRKAIRPLVNSLQRQDEILRDFYADSIYDKGIAPEVLERVGFDFTLMSRKTTLKNGWAYYIVNRYAYSFDQYEGKIAIEAAHRLEHIEKTQF